MFCPKCGTARTGRQVNCTVCDYDFSDDDATNDVSSQPTHSNNTQTPSNVPSTIASKVSSPIAPTTHTTESSTWHKSKQIAFPIVAVIVLIMCFMAASSISNSGMEIMQISSVGGRTLEEAYYRELGGIYSGYANIVRAMGISLASLLVWLGFKK